MAMVRGERGDGDNNSNGGDKDEKNEVVGGRSGKGDDGQGEEAAHTQIGRLASFFRHRDRFTRCDWPAGFVSHTRQKRRETYVNPDKYIEISMH